jgi:DNA-binding beta-propeller fold protein YncE
MAQRKFVSLFVVAIALASVVVSGPLAVATVGDLVPKGCIDDNDTGPDTCAQSSDGLNGPRAVAVSADGRSVYVTASSDDSLAIFDRDTQTGALTAAGCIDDNDTGADDCAQSTDGLDGAQTVTVSPDGTSVYATGQDDDAVVTFDRDTQTGALTPVGCIDDNDTGDDDCAQSTDGLDGAFKVTVSPDGASVYVAGLFDGAVVSFGRDTQTGALTPAGCIDDNDNGADACAQSTDGVAGAHTIAISEDGKSVYVTSVFDHALASFDRDTQTGALTPAGCIDNKDTGPEPCAQSTDALSPTGVVVSPDGKSVYATGDEAVVRFDRDTQTGALTPAGCIDDNDSGSATCAQSTDGMDGTLGMGISPDGSSVFVMTEIDNALVRFDRDSQGALSPAGCIDDNDAGPDTCAQSTDGLAGARWVAVTEDGMSLYAIGNGDDALVRFDRDTGDPPETTVTGPGKTTNRRPSFHLGSDDPAATFSCKLDKKSAKACSSPYRTPKLAFGRHVLKVTATDSFGNSDPSPAKKTFTIKKT